MRLSNIEVGLLMNFNSTRLMDGVKRLALSNPNSTSAISAFSAVNSSKQDDPTLPPTRDD